MDRRTLLKGLLAVAATASIGCAPSLSIKKDNVVENDVYAGNLYIHNATDYLTGQELENIVKNTRRNFDEAGIYFNDVSMGKDFPKLDGLDIMIYMVDGEAEGNFGIGEEEHVPYPERFFYKETDRTNYEVLKEKIGFPYDLDVSKTHTGFVSPDSVPIIIEKIADKPSRTQILNALEQLTTHEIAHGLGAVHLAKSLEPVYGHFLGDQHPTLNYEFHPKNVEKMKRFITKARSMRREDIHGLRQEVFNGIH